ncbi:hypothetical protein CK203_048230, partial [Vitis vinifera]
RALFLGHQRREPSSRVLESHPTHLSQSHLQRTRIPADSSRDRYQASHDSGPPIEGNLDCRDRSFHSETYFDIEALRQQPELEIHSDCCRDFREWSSFSQSDMVRILSRGTSTASVLTRRELPSGMLLIDVLLRANLFPLQHKVQRRGAILEALFRISEGYFFGPHHLIMTSLLHFEEKSIRRSFRGQMASHYYFRGSSARF